MNEEQQGNGTIVAGNNHGNGLVARSRGKSIFTAALVGAGVGAGIALLFAPRSGQETRGWLADKSREIKDKTTRTYEQGKAAARNAATEFGKVAEDVAKPLDRPASIGIGTAKLPR